MNEHRDCLDVTDFTAADVAEILDLAELAPSALGRPLNRGGIPGGVALIFEKPSNRTRHSMEIAVAQLGGHPVYTRGEEVGFDTREPVEDIARIMEGYHAVDRRQSVRPLGCRPASRCCRDSRCQHAE